MPFHFLYHEGVSSIDEVRDEVTKILSKKKKIEIIKKRFKSKSSLEALIENNEFLIETDTFFGYLALDWCASCDSMS